MFGIFRKTSWKIEGKAFDFFQQVFTSLPIDFQFLLEGLNNGLYRRYSVNHSFKENNYFIGFDPLQSDKSMIKGKQFELENIIIKQDEKVYILNLTIHEGLLVGFEFPKNIKEFTNFQVDISSIIKNKSMFSTDTKIEKLVSGLISEQLDLINLFEIEIEGKIYYQIKDHEDGNYIAIDNKGRVFGLIHEPYKIELINKSVRQFVDDVNNELFDFNKYLNGQSGYA
ncbi:MAG TPA: hypothetical protein PKC06_15770 [Saprospiraceae bacterium]|jgi:hypothetical protein|nr:hypothetical protein [Saprospiraceae bacterium]